MTRINWSASGERFFESGVDRGVLYTAGNPGVPWVGLISISESSNGGEPTPLYFDGIKYRNLAGAEEFEASLTALSSPSEFDDCVGFKTLAPGLIATQQPRKEFGLSYRTLIGNDVDGYGHGYKIHLVYNALASPSQRDYKSQSNSPDPANFNWNISTRAIPVVNSKHTAHLIVDSRDISAALLQDVEDVLYGTESTAPEMPTVAELIAILN